MGWKNIFKETVSYYFSNVMKKFNLHIKKKFLKQDNKENTLKHQRQIP